MSEEIFSKILSNSATEAEKISFYESLEKDSDKRKIYYEYKNIDALSRCSNSTQIPLPEDSFYRFWKSVNPGKRFNLVGAWYQYAAIFILALSLGILLHYMFSTHIEDTFFARQIAYTSEKGSVSTIHLEDGSKIWLSSGSKITIQKKSTGEMSAQLNGEAYFDLVPDPKRKFSVDLGYFKVKDIGTRFNIRSYSDESVVCTTLVDGQIDLYNNREKPIISLKPGEYLKFDKKTKGIAVSKQDPTIAIAWKDGKFVFIDKTLAEICRELENWYNVKIIIQNRSLADTRYTSVIKRSTTVNMVMKMLALTDKINYKIDSRKEAQEIVYVY